MIGEDLLSAPVFHLPAVGDGSRGAEHPLARGEAKHIRVLRLGPGDPVRLTDGAGALWAGRLDEDQTVRLLEPLPAPAPLDIELWAPVGNKHALLWLVEKAAEFGVRVLRPVESTRSRSVADAGRSKGFWKKAKCRALAAVKQSASAWLPTLHEPSDLERCIGRLADGGTNIVLERGGAPLSAPLSAALARRAAPIPVILVGPEGGFTQEELVACRAAGFRRGGLGPTTLRFETAAVAAMAIAAQHVPRTEPERTVR